MASCCIRVNIANTLPSLSCIILILKYFVTNSVTLEMNMNSSRWVGLSIGTLFLISTLFLFGSSVHASWYKMPIEAVNGIAFTLSFGLGLNHFLPTFLPL